MRFAARFCGTLLPVVTPGKNATCSPARRIPERTPHRSQGVCAAAATVLLVALCGCAGGRNELLSPAQFSISGVVQGALQPISDAQVHLYTIDPQEPSAVSNVELASPVRSDSHGTFQFPAAMPCPAADALIYLTAEGGVPAATGLANSSIGLLNVLGTCSSLSAKSTATIDEITTVGSAWPLAAFANDRNQFLLIKGQAAELLAAAGMIPQLVNSDLGTTPGKLLAAGETAPIAVINSLSNAIAACIVTNGGLAGDGSACGRLFSMAADNPVTPPTDTLSAALLIAKSPARNVSGIYALANSKGIFQPSLMATPFDWTLVNHAASTAPVATNPTSVTASANVPASASSPAVGSAAPALSRATAQVTAPVANPILITTGGVYQGNWVSTDPTVAAVTIWTDQPVVIQNSTVTGPGDLIAVAGKNGANVTVQNVTGVGTDPLVAGRQRGAFVVAYIMSSLTVQNCTMTGTRFGIKVGFAPASTVHILDNVATNLEDRASDGVGGFQTARPSAGHFVYFYEVTAPGGAEIGWNQLVQTMGQSSVDSAIELYKSQGTSTTPILVHDNYLEGMSSPAASPYLGSGLTATGDNTSVESAFVTFLSNQVVHTAGFGLILANGHDITAQNNRIVSCGQSSAGTWYTTARVDAVLLWNYSFSPSFYNNTVTGTAGGLIVPNSANQPVAADVLANPVDLQTASNSVSGNMFTDPCQVGGALTLSAEDAERAYWANKLATNKEAIGDQHGPVTVAVSPGVSTVNPGQAQQLTAVTTWASNTGVTWTLTPSIGIVSSGGLYTAPPSVTSTQTVTVTATSLQDPTKTASAAITVNAPVSVAVTPASASLVLSQSQQLTASVTNAANTAVTWSLSSAVGSISAAGVYTAPAALASLTTVTATANSVADPTKSATTTLTINPMAVVVTPNPVSLYASQSQQFSALVQGNANQSVIWSMTPSVGTLSATGLYTAPSSVTAVQTVYISADSNADSTKYALAAVTLLPPIKVNLYANYFVDTVNQTSQFSAQVQNTSNSAVVWTISPAVGTVSGTGLYTAPSAISSQQAITFTATSVADPTKSTSGTVLLNPPTKVIMSPSTATLLPSATQQFIANVAWNSNTNVTWSVSPALGTISATGLYTAPANTTAVQAVTVTATSVADPTKSTTATVTLNPPVAVSISPAAATVTLNQTQPFTATLSNTASTSVTWSISPAVGSISAAGVYSPPTTALTSPQTVTVTATSVVDTGKSASVLVTVNPPVAISVTPANSSLYAAQTQQFTPTVQWNTNTAATYTISPAVGTISSSGLYTAPSSITAVQTVTVTADSVADYTKYALASITLLPPIKVNLYANYFVDTVNQTSQLSAQVQNSSNSAVVWTISPAVGAVSSTGLYTAPSTIGSQQTITFTATSVADPTKSASGTIVLNPPVKVIMLPTSVSLLGSASQQFTANVAWAGSNTAVTWSMSPQLGTLSSAGLYTAPSPVTSQQTVAITATSVADPTKSAIAVVTLNPPTPVTISPGTAAINPGQTQVFSLKAAGVGTAATWSINPAFGTISSGGLYTPPATAVTMPQIVTVTATSVADPTQSSSATLTVNPPVAITLTPSSTSLYAGGTQQVTPTVQWNANTAVTYSLSPAVGTISSTGLYTAPSSITAVQTVIVTADSNADYTKYALASITLLPPIAVNLYTSHFVDTVNQTSQFSAQVQNTSNTAVIWTISPSVGTISSTGLYTAPSSIPAQQTITFTATSVADPTKSASGTVLLNPPVSVSMTPGSVTLTTSQTQQFSAFVAWSGNVAVTWSMSPSVGALSTSGLYTAPATINSNSTVAITATSVADPTKSATALVNLLTQIGPAPITITSGGTYSGNWISNDPTVPAVTVKTDAPVIIQNSTMQSRGNLIQINGINGANVTVRNVTATALDPQVAGQQRGAFITAYTMQALTVQNNTMSGVSFGVRIGTSPALTSLSILNNVGSQLEDRTSDGAGGLTTARPQLGHFVGLYQVTAPNGGEIAWNQMVQTIGQSSTEDAINIYNSQGASGFPLLVHDNYLEGYSSSTTGAYTGNGLITDGDASGVTSFVVFQANEMVHAAGGGVALASGHDNSAVANRVVSCGIDGSGHWYSRTGATATALWNFYGATNFNNNTITTTAGGMVSPDANGNPTVTDAVIVAPVGNSTNTGNQFTDPCLVGGAINLAAETNERAVWANKLSTNNIVLGDQH